MTFKNLGATAPTRPQTKVLKLVDKNYELIIPTQPFYKRTAPPQNRTTSHQLTPPHNSLAHNLAVADANPQTGLRIRA